jgi:hypothetical protein
MNRNVESHFALNPTRIDLSRSTFDRSSSVKTSFNAGDIVPFFLEEVLPGDTFNVKSSKVVRMQTLLTPMMDNVRRTTRFSAALRQSPRRSTLTRLFLEEVSVYDLRYVFCL